MLKVIQRCQNKKRKPNRNTNKIFVAFVHLTYFNLYPRESYDEKRYSKHSSKKTLAKKYQSKKIGTRIPFSITRTP